MPVVGTAGHVDHGKSTLIQALTGRDPDRLAEEKERGLTIDLGFAWTDLSGVEVSFVDVPGHERFMKNMLAGTEAIDAAMLVVAADEGWMPQTEEHLAVLDLLEIGNGVVAITKIDRVDDELLELAQLEVSERLEGTTLASAPVVLVSAVTGAGLAELREELRALCLRVDANRPIGVPTMWIDRSFSIDGAGTVVTGTLLGGELSVGQTVSIWPGDHSVRIRTLHSHETTHANVRPGRRTAANIVGIDRSDVGRGSLLTAQAWPTSSTFSVVMRPARYAANIGERGAYHLHMGTGSWPVELRPLTEAETPIPGAENIAGEAPGPRSGDAVIAALIHSSVALPVRVGERFILRETGRQSVVAGGRIVDPTAPRRGASARQALAVLDGILDASPDQAATMLLAARGVTTVDQLASWTGGGSPLEGTVVGSVAISPIETARLRVEAVESVRRFHHDHPLREGTPIASLASQLDIDIDAARAVVGIEPALADDGATIRLAAFSAGLTADQETTLASVATLLRSHGFAVPRLVELDLDRELLHVALRESRLVRVSDDLVYLPDQIAALTEEARALPSPFSVGDFKDRVGVSRKYAVPLLEYLDAAGITRRVGNDRILR